MKPVMIAIGVAVSIGLIVMNVRNESEVILNPVVEEQVEKTAEEKLQEARDQLISEIADLDAQIEALEAERDRKQEILD